MENDKILKAIFTGNFQKSLVSEMRFSIKKIGEWLEYKKKALSFKNNKYQSLKKVLLIISQHWSV